MGSIEQIQQNVTEILTLVQRLQPVTPQNTGIDWNKFYTAHEVAAFLNVTVNTVYLSSITKTKVGPNNGTTRYWGAHILHYAGIISTEQLKTLHAI